MSLDAVSARDEPSPKLSSSLSDPLLVQHHEFPQDFRNAIKYYQYDPTKWFIIVMYWLGLASQLKTFPDVAIKQGQFAMKLKALSKYADDIKWPTSSNHLPVLTWDECESRRYFSRSSQADVCLHPPTVQEACKTRELVVISGFIHDVSTFIDEHPGGRALVKTRLGKDATTAFYGGYYDHSNGATNLLAQLRVGVIEGGYEVESMKKYSEVIESLKESGAAGVSGKQSDLSTAVRKTVVIKGDPAHKSLPLQPLASPPRTDEMIMTGGLTQSFFE